MSHPAQPYAGLAAIYDYVMRHVDYASWAAYIDELLRHYACTPDALVDLACGTGSVGLELCALGLRVTQGVDQSEAMLRVARERALLAGFDVDFQVRDLRELHGLGPFGAAVCMYDSLNYMLDLTDVESALSAVHDILEPGGVFVFDLCTQQNSLRYFSDMHDEESGPGFEYRRHSYYDPAQRLQVNDFVITFEDEEVELHEHHEQRIHALADIHDAIARSDFELLGTFDSFTLDTGTENSDRVHFALRRTWASETWRRTTTAEVECGTS